MHNDRVFKAALTQLLERWRVLRRRLAIVYAIPVFLWMAGLPAFALDTFKPLSDLTHQTWSVDEGLPHSTVRSIAQTPDGYIWFATHEGAARFDGLAFTVFNAVNAPALRGSGVASLLTARDGSLVLGLRDGGLARFVRGKFEAILPQGEMPLGTVNFLAEDAAGSLWAAIGTGGLVQIRNNVARVFTAADGLPANAITALRATADGILWIGTSSGLAVFQNGAFSRHPTDSWLDTASIAAIAEDREKRVWFATNGQGIAVREGTTLRRYGRQQGLASDALTRLLVDRNGGVWVGSLEGVHRLAGNTFERFATPDGFTNNYVRDVFEDGEGSIWIGTDSGVNRFRDARITTWGVRKGLVEEFSRAVLEDRQGRIWVATSDGLFAVTPAGVRRYGRAQGLVNGAVLSLAEDPAGTLWIGTNGGGLHRLAGDNVISVSARFGITVEAVRVILPARDGTLWIGTSTGLLKASWKADVPVTQIHMDAGLPNEQLSALLEDKAGRIWVGTRGGLGIIEGSDSVVATRIPGIDASVLALNADTEGRIWASTNSGLAYVQPGASVASHQIRRLLPGEGVPAQTYFAAIDDHAGQIWTCGNRGIIKISKSQLAELAAGTRAKVKPVFYGKSEGMATAQCNGASQPAGWRARDGRIMFPTARGIAIADPAREAQSDLRAPPVHIKEVMVDAERVQGDASGYFDLPAGKHRIEISYVGLSLADPEKVRYRYQLSGFDPDWVDAGREAKAVYTNIAPGTYEFRVLASREGGAWSEPGATLTIEQQPRFHETTWFRIAFAAAFLVVVFVIYRGRIAQLNAQRSRLQQMVDERTRDLEQEKQKLESTNNEKARLLLQVAEAAKAYERLSKEDSLTGLGNRRELDHILAHEFERAVRNGRPLSVALADLDFFKKVNDLHSHAVGDDVLRQVAQLLRDGCRSIDMVGRYGGEEFVLVLPEADRDMAYQICERLRVAIERFDWAGKKPGLKV
ncbi:MAG: two-component regulator propeller domain-containing protein, partial [Betaproteobacteria bacterium]